MMRDSPLLQTSPGLKELLREVARDQPSADRAVGWALGAAACLGVRAARVEGAARGGVERGGELAFEDDALALLAEIDARRRGEEGLRVGVKRALEDRLLRPLLGGA